MEDNNIKTYVDKLLGDDGLQFSVNLAPETYLYLTVAITVGMFSGYILNRFVAKLT